MKQHLYLCCVVAGLSLLTSSAARADFLLSNPGLGGIATFGQDVFGTGGYTFTVGPSALQVTRLGIWDQDGDGLFESHQVGLWAINGTLLGSVTVPGGTSAALVGEFRYEALLAPLTLAAGEVYVIGAHYPTSAIINPAADRFRLNNSAQMAAIFSPHALLGEGRSTSGFSFPNPTGFDFRHTGPNLEFTIAPVVPEPTGWLLASLGLAGLLVLMRRKPLLRGALERRGVRIAVTSHP